MEKSYTEVVWLCGEKISILNRKRNAGDGTSWVKIPHQRQIDFVNRGMTAIGATEDEVHDISRSVTDVATEHLRGFGENPPPRIRVYYGSGWVGRGLILNLFWGKIIPILL